jgi:hypothetical protein
MIGIKRMNINDLEKELVGADVYEKRYFIEGAPAGT